MKVYSLDKFLKILQTYKDLDLFNMNYNDKIYIEQGLVMNTQEDESYQSQTMQQSNQNTRMSLNKLKQNKQNYQKAPNIRGKQNDSQSFFINNGKPIVTNHSFNGFFNSNIKKNKRGPQQQVDQKIVFSDCSKENNQVNFNSSGKLSNLQFVGDSSKDYSRDQSMHPQVKNFMKKYFPHNYQMGQYYGQYVTLNDFVQILLEEFENIIGSQNQFTMIEQFTEKVYLIFGEIIYFQELFLKTLEKGLIGIIFQIFKCIQEQQRQRRQQSNNPQKSIMIAGKTESSNMNSLKNFKNCKYNGSNQSQQGSRLGQSNITKISLDRFFGSSFSKVQLHQQSTRMTQQNLEQIKQILQSYIESMYKQAECKLNKKYSQQMKRVTLKFKEAQKLLQKVNQKISTHFDSIQLQKDYEKKIKVMTEKQKHLQNLIKNIQFELKVSKDELQKQKSSHSRTNQDLNRMKQKLQKYQNAIFQKAMEKNSTINNLANPNSVGTGTPNASKISNQPEYSYQSSKYQQNPLQVPKFELKIDTFTQHKPFVNPIHVNPVSYSPIMSRVLNNPLTHSRLNENQRGSVSPIKQRISFIKTPNPILSTQKVINQTQGFNPTIYGGQAYKVYNSNVQAHYGDNFSNSNRNIGNKNYGNSSNLGQYYGNDKLKVSNVQKLQVGQKAHLRPLSPIGKLGELDTNQAQYQRGHSPIRVQFCTSRGNTISTNIK